MSQTRVCEPPQPERVTHTNRSGADQKLVRRPHCSGVTTGPGLAGFNRPDVSDLPLTQSTLAPPPTGLTFGLQVIEGLHSHAGVEFRSLSEDFDTSTPTGKLQLRDGARLQ